MAEITDTIKVAAKALTGLGVGKIVYDLVDASTRTNATNSRKAIKWFGATVLAAMATEKCNDYIDGKFKKVVDNANVEISEEKTEEKTE